MDDEVRRTEAEVHYLQHSDGSWSLIGGDGWPMDPRAYLAQLVESGADVSALTTLGLTVIAVERLSVTDTEHRRELE
ncbi:hypothetical protein [Nocardia aurantiaca]|uniref:Uncharacterized protein n=1 Tax=Nocardia aurantiaca TaxID=2675850 RepID=A0A6I3KVA5_9NOCA|nr:hypothetical protein [Nocardia aurantiaca]MTE11429.1 hypothetical protein [Nocardia aurantiaca]